MTALRQEGMDASSKPTPGFTVGICLAPSLPLSMTTLKKADQPPKSLPQPSYRTGREDTKGAIKIAECQLAEIFEPMLAIHFSMPH